MWTYDAIAVLGKAYDFERQCYPEQLYESLRVAARMYHAGRAAGGIAVCGAVELKALERGQHAPTTESEEMETYLVQELCIPEDVIYADNASTNTPDNFVNLKLIAMQQSWRHIYMPIAAPRIKRAAFLAQKICYGQCDFAFEGVEVDEVFLTEEKLLGDMVCTLKDMEWGDHNFLLKPDGTSNWDALRKEHYSCPYYVSTDDILNGSLEPFKNFHPESLVAAYGMMRQ